VTAVAGVLADVWVAIRGRTDQVGKDIQRDLPAVSAKAGEDSGKKFSDSFGTGLKRLVTTLGATFAGFELVDLVKESIEAGREAAQALRLTDAVIKSTGGSAGVTAEQVHRYSEELSNATGVQNDVIQSGANVALTFTQVRNTAGAGNDIFNQFLASALDVSAGLHQNLQPSIIQIGKALNDPITGMTTLRRIGISFTADQIAQAQALQKSGNLMGAQKVILAELNKEFGGAAAAASDPAQKAQVAWHNFKEELGTKLMPVVQNLAVQFTNFLPTLASIGGRLADLVAGTIKFVEANKTMVEVLGGAVLVFGALGTIIEAVKAVHAAWLVITLAEDAALDANPIGVIVLAIAALVAGIIYAYKHSALFREIVQGALNAVKVAAESVANFFTKQIPEAWSFLYEHTVKIFQGVRNAIVEAWQAIVAAVTAGYHAVVDPLIAAWNAVEHATLLVWDRIRDFFAKWWPLLLLIFFLPIGLLLAAWNHFHTEIEGVAKAVWTTILVSIKTIWNALLDAARAVWETIRITIINPIEWLWARLVAVFNFIRIGVIAEWQIIVASARAIWEAIRVAIINPIQAVWNFLSGIAANIRNAIVGAFDSALHAVLGVADQFQDVGHNIIMGIIHGIEHAAGWLADAVKHALSSALDGAKSFLGISSPSKVFADEVGQWIPAGVAQGIAGYGDLSIAMPSLTGAAITAGAATVGAGGLGGGDTGTDLLTQIRDLLAALNLTVGPEGLALTVRTGEQRLAYRE
jgi:phage-related protein